MLVLTDKSGDVTSDKSSSCTISTLDVTIGLVCIISGLGHGASTILDNVNMEGYTCWYMSYSTIGTFLDGCCVNTFFMWSTDPSISTIPSIWYLTTLESVTITNENFRRSLLALLSYSSRLTLMLNLAGMKQSVCSSSLEHNILDIFDMRRFFRLSSNMNFISSQTISHLVCRRM